MSDLADPWARGLLAARLLCLDPKGLGGLWLRARPSPARDALVAQLAPLAARPIHPNVDRIALSGGLDIEATLAEGRPVARAGLLASAPALTLAMAERADVALAARLAQGMDAGLPLVAVDEGEADEAPPAGLTERLGLFAALDGARPARVAAIDLAAARGRVTGVTVPPEALEALVRTAAALGIASARAPLFALAAARAHAALRGARAVEDADLEVAAALALAHRATVLPETDEEEAPPPPDTGDGGESDGDGPAEDRLVEAARASLPRDLLERLALMAMRGAAGSGAGPSRAGNRRGRPLPARPGRPDGRTRLDAVATLRAAAPWQPLRRREARTPRPLHIHPTDLHVARAEERADRLLIFAVDASGSTAMARLGEAKGAVEILLAQAYARRDHVALVAFRGTGAEVLLPPTRSLVQTRRRLAGLPGGGGTPLADGLMAALEVGRQARAKGFAPALVLLADGRPNVALGGSPGRAQAAQDARDAARHARSMGLSGVVIDTGTRPSPLLPEIAALMDAPCIALPRADARSLSRTIDGALA